MGCYWRFIFSGISACNLGILIRLFLFLKILLGHWGKGGKIDPEFYYALVTMHGTILVFFVLTAGLSGTFSNFLIPFQVGARDMASPFLNMLSYWFFFSASIVMFSSLFMQTGPASGGWTIYPPLSALGQASDGAKIGMDLWLLGMALFIVSQLIGRVKLYFNHTKYAYQRNEYDEAATHHLGIFLYSSFGSFVFSCFTLRLRIIII